MIKLKNIFEKEEFKVIVQKAVSHSLNGKNLNSILQTNELKKALKSGTFQPEDLAEHPYIAEIILAEDYLDQVENPSSVASILVEAIKQSSIDHALQLGRFIFASKFASAVHPIVNYKIQIALASRLGSIRYLELYDSQLTSQTVLPSFDALDGLDAASHLSYFTQVFSKVASNRSNDISTFHNSNYQETEHLVKSTMAETPVEVALNLVRQAAEDHSLVPELEKIMDKYFGVLSSHNMRNISELNTVLLVNKELVIEYFFMLKRRVSFADRAIYFDFGSIKKLIEAHSRADPTLKLVFQMAVKEVINKDKSSSSETYGFDFKLMPEETMKLVARISPESQKRNDPLVAKLAGYFAAKSNSVACIAHMVIHQMIPKKALNSAYDTLATDIVKNNPPPKIDSILKKLQAEMKVESMSEYGSAIDGVVIPILTGNFEKAWKSAYNLFILPGQQETMTNILLEFLDQQYRSLMVRPDNVLVPNARLREQYPTFT